MITRTIHGLPFRVISPSFYELASHPEIDISFVGKSCPEDGSCWYLHVPDENGEPLMQPFNSLDEAAGFVALGVL